MNGTFAFFSVLGVLWLAIIVLGWVAYSQAMIFFRKKKPSENDQADEQISTRLGPQLVTAGIFGKMEPALFSRDPKLRPVYHRQFEEKINQRMLPGSRPQSVLDDRPPPP